MRARHEARASALLQARTIATVMVIEQGHVFMSTRTLMTALADIPEIANAGPSCPATLARLADADAQFHTLSVSDTSGVIVCSSNPLLIGRPHGDTAWSARVFETRAYTVGRYHVGFLSGLPLVRAGLPIPSAGPPARAIYATLDINWLITLGGRVPMPAKGAALVIGGDGRIIARNPPTKDIGQFFFERPSDLEAARRSVNFERTAADGVRRIFAFAKLPGAGDSGELVAVGVPAGPIVWLDRYFWWQAAVATVLTLLLAIILARRQTMSDLERERARRQQSDRFFRAIIEKAFDAVVIMDADETLLYASPAVFGVIGYTPEEMTGRKIYEFGVQGDVTGVGRIIELAPASGAIVESRLVHKSGSIRDVELSANQIEFDGQPCVAINFRDITDRVEYERELRNSRDELRSLGRRVVTEVDDERRRISREVHDDLGQYVAALALDVGWLKKRADDLDPQRVERLNSMESLVQATAQSVRRIATQLHAGIVDRLGLREAVLNYARQFSERSGIPIELQVENVRERIDDHTATTVFRILQEALTNVARHSNATKVRLLLNGSEETLRLEVHDNGIGMHAANRSGLGLLSMQERALARNGTVEIAASPLGGVAVIVVIPL